MSTIADAQGKSKLSRQEKQISVPFYYQLLQLQMKSILKAHVVLLANRISKREHVQMFSSKGINNQQKRILSNTQPRLIYLNSVNSVGVECRRPLSATWSTSVKPCLDLQPFNGNGYIFVLVRTIYFFFRTNLSFVRTNLLFVPTNLLFVRTIY